jgi:hypothetical protein
MGGTVSERIEICSLRKTRTEASNERGEETTCVLSGAKPIQGLSTPCHSLKPKTLGEKLPSGQKRDTKASVQGIINVVEPLRYMLV